MENLLVPNQPIAEIPCQRALVFAPHPDDEVFGCGGAIMRHIEHGGTVHVIIVSDGAYGVSTEQATAYVSQRQQESIAAARILGYGIPVFWQYRDRQISYDEKLIQEILTAIRETEADLVYAPSVFEMHPDHRLLAMAVIEAVRRIASRIRIVLYEIGMPLRPNLLLDISNIMPRKIAAMECFASQNARQRYDLHIAALNRYRTYTLPAEVTAAEAYILLSAEEIANDPLKLYQSEHSRQRELGLPLTGTDLPLVSVIIRSMDRPTLSEALDSIALQTYPNIEVVIVNAKGAEHREVDLWCGRFPMRMIGKNEPLNRSHAANVGLHAAQGNYLSFLDDDDLFYPEHIATLITALQNHTSARCAYTGIKVEYYHNEHLEAVTEFNEPFDQRRLWGRNFIPIHAVLFEQSLVAKDQCGFDEDLDLFEDWDFWIQLAQHGEMVHTGKITAVYRNYGHSNLGFKQNESFIRKSRGKVFEKWKKILSGEQLDDLIEYREKTITDIRIQLASNEQLIASLQDRIQQDALAATQREQQFNLIVADLNRTTVNLNGIIEDRNKTIKDQNKIIADRNKTIDDLLRSTSWRITAGLRFFSRLMHGQYSAAWGSLRRRILPHLKKIYWRLPVSWRRQAVNVAYRSAGPLFSGLEHYEAWRMGKINGTFADVSNFQTGMTDLADISPLQIAPGRIAIHAHMFYADLATEFADFLSNMPFPYDLYVSVPNESARLICQQAFSSLLRLEQLIITVVPNRGRDIAPMLCTFGDSLLQYEYIAHIHSKKSLYNDGATNGWREYLLTNLLGNEQQIRKIFTLLANENRIGLVYPQNFSGLPYAAYTWLSNQAMGKAWCNKLSIKPFPVGYFDFPAGSMFWARSAALRPLFEAGIGIDDFSQESGQTDATLAHCLERLLVLITRKTGFNAAILRDESTNNWSRWRFEQYLMQTPASIQDRLSDASIQVVIFDIFDTLVTRPLLYPEKIKSIIAQQAGTATGSAYLEYRAVAESQARQKAGRDVDLDAIYKELAVLSGLTANCIEDLRHLEETIESDAVIPRPEVVSLLNLARNQGKRILLASDMYLPRSIIELILRNNGITGWDQLYLSSEIGLRKDTGDLYRHLLSVERITPDAALVIGDNEHSDVQIPGNMKMNILHVLRPVELARATLRMGPLIEKSIHQDDLNIQLTLGAIVQKNFQPLTFPQFDPSDLVPASPWAIGFTVVGPLILSFVQWLAKKAAADGIKRLFFLSREGQILKSVYDRWTSNDSRAIASDYLVLSRRSVVVPMISNLEDICEIARIRFFPNQLPMFLSERFGITLSSNELDELAKRKLWPKDKLVSVEDRNIDHLMPLLRELEKKILDQAQSELPGLLAYLNKMELDRIDSPAIIDIGYAATIQGRLNQLTNKTIHGYYLITEERAQKIAELYKVITQGCFGHFINAFIDPPLIFRKSFSMEKLLSSDDAQIMCYKLNSDGDIVPEFRQLNDTEKQTGATRAAIRQGIMDFVDQGITMRDNLASDYVVPLEIAKELFEIFVEQPSRSELDILSKLTLDDYYCGRGLVN